MLHWNLLYDLLAREFTHYNLNNNIHEIGYKVKLVDKLYNCHLRQDNRKIANALVDLDLDSEFEKRDSYSIVKKITEIWKVFFPKDEREICFNPDYKPYFYFHGEEIPYDNISAGEKMILLILIKTLLINIYTDISFLILDEPLEHLNLENRIKIVDYFIELCEKNIINQLIITTFEESLTRKYINLDKKVNIISIPSLKKYKVLSP